MSLCVKTLKKRVRLEINVKGQPSTTKPEKSIWINLLEDSVLSSISSKKLAPHSRF